MITREAKLFWDSLDMVRLRAEWIAEVEALVRDNGYTFADVSKLIQEPSEGGCGVFDEGDEIEPDLKRKGDEAGVAMWTEEFWDDGTHNGEDLNEALWAGNPLDDLAPQIDLDIRVASGDDPLEIEDAKEGLKTAALLRKATVIAKK